MTYKRINTPQFVQLKPWTEEERQFALANAGKMQMADIGKALGRSKSSVIGMINRARAATNKHAVES